jgi:putative transposase
MSRYRRADAAGATYFFTVVTYRRQAILCETPVREALGP